MVKLISIEKIVNRGSGMGYDDDNKVVFIPFTVEGDVVNTIIVKSKRSFEIGSIKSIEIASPKRIKAKCPSFGICGGCSYQHISYNYELEVKKRQSDENFNYDLGEIFSADEFYYRNKVTFHASYRSGSLKLGFMMAGSNRQVDVENCYLVPNFINELKNDIEKENFLKLKKVVFRIDSSNKKILINFIGNNKKEEISRMIKKKRDVFEKRVNDKKEKLSVIKFINSEKLDKKSIDIKLNDVSYSLGSDDFFQINYKVASEIYKDILEQIKKDNTIKNAVDGFCGSMSIGLQLKSLNLDKIYGIEISDASVKQARENILLNSVKNVKILKGDFNQLIKGIEVDFNRSALIIDPPREGIGSETMEFINSLGFKKVLYLSCDQMTLKRDVTELRDYTLCFNRVYDMFPRTFHVETLLVFDKD